MPFDSTSFVAPKPNPVADALRAARAKIENRKNWTQHWYVRNGYGKRLDVNSDYRNPKAAKWCATGALHAVCEGVIAEKAYKVLRSFTRHPDVEAWNDYAGRTHAEVMELFDRAIAYAEEKAHAV
jgi:hypothetical protein